MMHFPTLFADLPKPERPLGLSVAELRLTQAEAAGDLSSAIKCSIERNLSWATAIIESPAGYPNQAQYRDAIAQARQRLGVLMNKAAPTSPASAQ